jgi:hypothetical protein
MIAETAGRVENFRKRIQRLSDVRFTMRDSIRLYVPKHEAWPSGCG